MNLDNIQILTHDETLRQHKLMLKGDIKARNKLIESSLRWLHKLVGQYCKNRRMGSFKDDIIQDFSVYFLRKINEWNPKKGKLTTFLNACIKGFLLEWYSSEKCLNSITYIPRDTKNLAIKFRNDSSTLDNLTSLRKKCVLDAFRLVKPVNISDAKKGWKTTHLNTFSESHLEDVELFNKLFKLCNEKEQKLLKLRYFEGLNDCEIARGYNVTRMAIQHRFRDIFNIFALAIDNGDYNTRSRLVRNCPDCQKEIEYSGILAYKRGIKNNRSCQSCTRKRVMSVKSV